MAKKNTHKLNVIVHITNIGGMSEMTKAANMLFLDQMRSGGKMSEEEYTNLAKTLEDAASKPLKELYRFSKLIELPFVPTSDIAIDVGAFRVDTENIIWKGTYFECHIVYSICGMQCDACERDIQYFLDDANGWGFLLPEFEDNDFENPFTGGHIGDEDGVYKNSKPHHRPELWD